VNAKQQEAINKLEQLGKVKVISQNRTIVFVEVVIQKSPNHKEFDTYKIYNNGKAKLIG
jgi:hypothetical protein